MNINCLSYAPTLSGRTKKNNPPPWTFVFKKLLRWIRYSGTQRMIELALFTIVPLQLCTIEKVIYKTKLDEYIYLVGLDNPYRLKNWFYNNCYTLTSSNVTFAVSPKKYQNITPGKRELKHRPCNA